MQSHSEIIQRYRHANKRLFLLDYDGVLTPIVGSPELAKPTPELLNLLRKLADNKQNKVVIVTGRSHEEIQSWLGGLPVDLSAEHGSFRKVYNNSWEQLGFFANAWKEALLPTLEAAVNQLPGSFIEHKTTALVFHYRNSDQQLAESTVKTMKSLLQKQIEDLPLVIQDGKKVIDIHLSQTNKGTAIQYWLEQKPVYDFILIAGDDITDEDMYTSAPSGAYTYHVGTNKTGAKTSVIESTDLVAMLEAISTVDDIL